MRVVVVGCGVSGLSAGVRLAEDGHDVRIVARDLAQQTTSSVAAAIWYPYRVSSPPESAQDRDLVLEWAGHTLATLIELARVPAAGVTLRRVVELFRDEPDEPWWATAVPDLHWLQPNELARFGGNRRGTEAAEPAAPAGRAARAVPTGLAGPSGDVRAALAFTTPVVEMPIYLDYLCGRLERAGGVIEQRTATSLDAAAREADLVVNCTGAAARELAGDASVTPIRGQVVRVANPGLEQVLLDAGNSGGLTYVVPRSGDCVLGGTAEEDNASPDPDPGTAEAIVRRCATLEPRLAGARVLGHRVGFRPARPGVRLEIERLADGTACVHNYGHGGAGVTLSWGCSGAVAELVRTT
jgi:D-amino-acid oxidase